MTNTDDAIATDETCDLIASDKVEGTAVYNTEGEKLGAIHNFMVDKASGQVEYAVLKFGDFLGLGGDFYPLPWEALSYDVDQEGYVVDLDKAALEDAPHYSSDAPRFDQAYGEQVYRAYGISYPTL